MGSVACLSFVECVRWAIVVGMVEQFLGDLTLTLLCGLFFRMSFAEGILASCLWESNITILSVSKGLKAILHHICVLAVTLNCNVDVPWRTIKTRVE